MHITEKQARLAGETSRQFSLTDEELDIIIHMTILSIAFLEGKGTEWTLAVSPLRQELTTLRGFVRERKRG